MRCSFRPSYTLRHQETGFTLVELMLALFVSALVMAAVMSVYTAQTKSYTVHDDIADIQQNLRGALAIMPMDIRLAGYHSEDIAVTPGFLGASRTSLQFTRDIKGNAVNANDSDGDVNDTDENITYTLNGDNDGDGIVDNGGANWSGTSTLARNNQPVADNIEALEFNYILDNDATSLNPANLNVIRSVQVSILARASFPDQNFTHSGSYTTASGATWTPPQNDHFRRRMVITTIQCRNLGL